MSKVNRILAVILALQVVALIIVYWPSTSVATGEPLFKGLEAEQIVALTIRDSTGNEVHLAQGAEGWVLPEAGDFPVGEADVQRLLDQIADLRADRLVTRTVDSHERLKVADDAFERLVEFELADGTHHKLYLGSSPSFNVLHVRADDEDEVYLTLGLTVSDVGATEASWINATYFSMPQNEIVKITLENKNGRFEFEKDEADRWTMINLPSGETLVENNVSSLATRISSLQMTRPLGQEEEAAYGLDEPNAQVTVVTQDADGNEKTYVVRVGALLDGENGYVVKSATSPFYVLMTPYTVENLLNRTMQDFIEQPPTPTAPAEPAEQQPTPTP